MHLSVNEEQTLEEKSSKSLSLAMRRPEDGDDDIMARRANAVEAGWNAAACFSASRATEAIIVEEKGAMVFVLGYGTLINESSYVWCGDSKAERERIGKLATP